MSARPATESPGPGAAGADCRRPRPRPAAAERRIRARWACLRRPLLLRWWRWKDEFVGRPIEPEDEGAVLEGQIDPIADQLLGRGIARDRILRELHRVIEAVAHLLSKVRQQVICALWFSHC